jgi:rhamnogalacturonyl hydrolase YesR
MTVSDLLEQICYKSDNVNKLVQVVNKLATSLLMRQRVDKLLEQRFHNLLTSLLQT